MEKYPKLKLKSDIDYQNIWEKFKILFSVTNKSPFFNISFINKYNIFPNLLTTNNNFKGVEINLL